MTYMIQNKISYDDSANLTAFGRLRTSDTRLLGEYRYMYSDETTVLEMNDKLSGSGTITPDLQRNCYLANVTTASGDKVIRQTKQYHPYIAGTSNLCSITFKMDTAKVNLVQSVGMFDDSNGIFFRMNGLTPEVVIRKNGTDNEVIPRSQWNTDRLDGSNNQYNPSGINMVWNNCQILSIDYQWLGVGRVRIGFATNGNFTVVHKFEHANVTSEVYMNQPSLPCRWEISNSGTVTSNSQLMLICAAVYCEGSDTETGYSKSISTANSSFSVTVANSNANGFGVLAIRMKNQIGGKPNRAFGRLKHWNMSSTEDIQYKIAILPDSSFISNTTVWSNTSGLGWCEYTKGFSLSPNWQANTSYSIIVDDYVLGAGGTGTNISSGINSLSSLDNRSDSFYQNFNSDNSQILAIIAYRLAADAIVRANLNWLEII